ncbi:MAG: 50S ribosomal protein L30 [Methanothrix sp.]|jgi:large subunit ribosomal protein L30|uniref:50S ribosomal protein L30 n=1 Tax=Methanothrix sp. TaxID=90426 RepID=UPI0025D649E1|nr:50S ribosomal protein L30 [Methanothrix sp.]MCK9405868.1 50S ribosomal protein L30 [Methanothrix sp.]
MFAIVRLRGEVNLRPDIKDTLAMLHIHRVNHCVVVKEDPHYRGMIQKVKDYVAWGEIDDDTLAMLLERRGRLSANRRLTEQYLKENTPYSSFKELAKAINSGSASLKDLQIKPIFRLHPARKGLRTTKKTAQQGGDLGFHKNLADLIKRMR